MNRGIPDRTLLDALLSALGLGALSTLGDWIWMRYIPDGAIVPGVVHGLLIFLILAFVLGWSARTPGAVTRLLATLPLAGAAIAAAFYPIAYQVGYLPALLVSWVAMWLTLALLQRWARRGEGTLAASMGRGVLAAVGSGLAFWAISGIWTAPSAGPPNWVARIGAWTFAFLPGFAALLIRRFTSRSDA